MSSRQSLSEKLVNLMNAGLQLRTEADDEQRKQLALTPVVSMTDARKAVARLNMSSVTNGEHLRQALAATQVMATEVRLRLKGSRKAKDREVIADAEYTRNAILSLIEAKETHDLSSGDVMTTRGVVLSKLERVEDFFDPHKKEVESHQVTSGGFSIGAGRGKLDDLSTLRKEDIDRYDGYKAKLPKNSTQHKLRAIRLPVLAIFNRGLSEADLEAKGFNVSSIGRYLVLNNQMVWAFSKEALESEGLTVQEYLESALKTHKRRTGIAHTVVGDEGEQAITVRSSKGVLFYWIMPEREYNSLGAKVRQWGFPFDRI